MTLTEPKSRGCKGSNSEPSRTKHLAFIGSYPAAALAVGFALVTMYVLFKDVADGAPITPDHVMSMAVLIGTFASGHLLWGQLQQWRILPALGLTVLFAAGTFYCVTSAGGRNAAAQGEKAGTIHQSNEDRARVEADLKEAKERLRLAQDGEEQECAGGEGKKCKARRATRQERETYVRVLEAQLRLSDPRREENPELRHAAKLFAAVPGVTAKEAAIFDALVLFFPFVKALFCEVATLVFGGIGFRSHGPTKLSQSHPTIPVSVPQSHSVPLGKAEALRDLVSLIQSSGTVPSQDALRLRWNRPKSTVSRWLIEFEAKGQITRSQQGKFKAVNSRPMLVVR